MRAATVLLVDDDPDNLQLLCKSLQGQGHRLLLADNGSEALTIAAQTHPDLVLLDIMMPDPDGFEVCRRIKEDPHLSDIAVIFLSALDRTSDKVRGLGMGAVDYIAKPFQPQEVLARVAIHLKIRRLEQDLARHNRQLEADNQHILEAVAEGICGLDPSGRIVFANPAACRLTGFSEDELRHRDVRDLFVADAGDQVPASRADALLQRTLATGDSTHSDREQFSHNQGRRFPVELTLAPLLRTTEPRGAVLAFQDITERKRNEQALRTALAEVETLKEKLQAEKIYLMEEIRSERHFGEIVGDSVALRTLLAQVDQVGPTDSTVLIQGETGTGKESIARAIHNSSPRSVHPLIKVNCGAIVPTLIESELFGHERGAFTGALKRRIGYFELANAGTLFLDEVGELPSEAQVKLLRVLQEREFARVGSERLVRVDVRVTAASNRDLEAMVESGEFRADLYYRLSVFPLRVPPLRERRGDIPLLAAHFLTIVSRKLAKRLDGIAETGMQRLLSYDWPGNIRELQNVIERAAILDNGPLVDIGENLLSRGAARILTERDTADGIPPTATLADNERRHIQRILARVGWVIGGKGGAAEILDLPPSTLRSRMKKLGIRKGD